MQEYNLTFCRQLAHNRSQEVWLVYQAAIEERDILSKRIAQGAAWYTAALCLAMALIQPAGAEEGFRSRVGTQTDSVSGSAVTKLLVNDTPVAVFKTTSGGHGPAVRAQAFADRLQTLIANGLAPGEVTAQRSTGRAWSIIARKESLVVVTPEEAFAHRSTSEALARSWADGLRRLLAEPPLTFQPAGITIPLGETRLVKIGGAALADDVVAQDTDVHTSQGRYDPASRTLTVRGLAPGRAAVNIQAGQANVSIPVVVMKYAARVSRTVTVSVTGQPSAPPDVVSQAIYSGLARAVNAEPGAQMRLTTSIRTGVGLSTGQYITVPIALHVTGMDLLPVEATTIVTVQNMPVSVYPATALFYSNNPEQVKQGQSLFAGLLQPHRPIRLDYHHQNASGGTLVFHTDLINAGDASASVLVISGLSLPALDTVQVGRRAGASFLKALDANVGLVFRVPPHARVPLVTQRFAQGLTVSGIVQMQQIDGPKDSVSLEVSADSDQASLVSPVARVILAAMPDSRSAAPLPDEPTDYGNGVPLPTLSPFVFETPQIALSGSYTVGGKWAYVRIGHTEALKDATGKLTLFGNYGADYRVWLTLTNPTPMPRPVSVFFAPEAGLAAAVFRVDGGPRPRARPDTATHRSPNREVHAGTGRNAQSSPGDDSAERLFLPSQHYCPRVVTGAIRLLWRPDATSTHTARPTPNSGVYSHTKAQTARAKAGLFTVGLFAVVLALYWATPTRLNTFDAVSYANQIGRLYPHTEDRHWLFHPHHLLFNAVGYVFVASQPSFWLPRWPTGCFTAPQRSTWGGRRRTLLLHPPATDAAIPVAALSDGDRPRADIRILDLRDRWTRQYAEHHTYDRRLPGLVPSFGTAHSLAGGPRRGSGGCRRLVSRKRRIVSSRGPDSDLSRRAAPPSAQGGRETQPSCQHWGLPGGVVRHGSGALSPRHHFWTALEIFRGIPPMDEFILRTRLVVELPDPS